MAYAALSYDDVAARTRIGESTLRRIASASRPRGATLDELWLIADACEVPRRWLEADWKDAARVEDAEVAHEIGHALLDRPLLGEGSVEQRLHMVEQYLHALLLEQERQRPELVPPRPAAPPRKKRDTSPANS